MDRNRGEGWGGVEAQKKVRGCEFNNITITNHFDKIILESFLISFKTIGMFIFLCKIKNQGSCFIL